MLYTCTNCGAAFTDEGYVTVDERGPDWDKVSEDEFPEGANDLLFIVAGNCPGCGSVDQRVKAVSLSMDMEAPPALEQVEEGQQE